MAVQIATDANFILKTRAEAIKPILAVEYPLPAPRPKNSRMDTAKLAKAIEQIGDMSKLQHYKRHWTDEVKTYVTQLIQDKLI